MDDFLPPATVSAFLHLGLDLFSHLLLPRTAIHPFRLIMIVMAGDIKGSAGDTNRVPLVAFLASDPTGPATIKASYCAFVGRALQ
jgi:hypothetical protein